MCTKDYNLLVKVLVKAMKREDCANIAEYNNVLLSYLCNALERDNGRFSTELFHNAICQGMEGKG